MIPDFTKNDTVYIKTDNGYKELGKIRQLEFEASYGAMPTLDMEVAVTYKEHKDDSVDAIRYNQYVLGVWEKENPCMKEVDNMEEFEVEKTWVVDPEHLDRGTGLVVDIDKHGIIAVYFENWTNGHNCDWFDNNIKDKYLHDNHCWNYYKNELKIVDLGKIVVVNAHDLGIDISTQIDTYTTKQEIEKKEEMEMKETKKLYGLVDMYKERAVEKIDEYFDEKIDNIIENDKRIVDYKNIVSNFNNTLNEFINGLDDKEKRMFEEYSEDMITYPFEIDYDEVEQYLDVDKINNAKTLELQDLDKMLKEVYTHLDLVGTADEGVLVLNDIYGILKTYDILDEHNHLKEYTIKNVIDDKKCK